MRLQAGAGRIPHPARQRRDVTPTLTNQEPTMGNTIGRTVLAATLGLILTVTGCSGGTRSVTDLHHEEIRVGIILPDIETSAQWDRVDEPLLGQANGYRGLGAGH
jgi:hypothetical protein